MTRPRRDRDEEQGRRDFAGRSLLINLLRVFHIAGLAGLSAAILAAGGALHQWAGLMLVTGLGIIALDAWANPLYFRQAKGVGTVFKILLVGLMMAWEPGRQPLFWFLLAFSVALSHAPGRIRHRQLY
ncbi:MAG: hypothetical protein HZA62_08335 [Rhodocyclales bacterium]|nr:hypothetical protein [Rhodocyclales bacterium]